MQDTDLHDMLAEIRITRDDGPIRVSGHQVLTDAELANKEVLDPVTISYVATKKYPTGTPTYVHHFPKNEKFIGIITVTNAHGQTYVSNSRLRWASRPRRLRLAERSRREGASEPAHALRCKYDILGIAMVGV